MSTTIDNSPATVNLAFAQGDDLIKTFRIGSRLTPESEVVYWDLTGWTGKSQIRKKATSTTVLAELTFTLGDGQAVPETAGYFTVSLSAADSSTLPAACVWDLELTNDSDVKRTYFAGTVTVSREVTRS